MQVRRKHQNSKFAFYSRHLLAFPIPNVCFRSALKHHLQLLEHADDDQLQARIDYCFKGNSRFKPSENAISLKELPIKKRSAYALDLHSYLRYFNPSLRFDHLFGDITKVPPVPTLLKSRPINEENQNSILLRLNSVRHFNFIEDTIPYKDKENRAVWRGGGYQPNRKTFLKAFHNHPLCDVGQSNPPKSEMEQAWSKPRLTIPEQLSYKFILSIEGNDVATNLKWIMSSNSLCFMTKPRFETWFMEGQLIPGHHYVLLKDDYSDLEEKIAYYSEHEEEAEVILQNAKGYTRVFENTEIELALSLQIVNKYFKLSGQI